jgi:hypothetical protein
MPRRCEPSRSCLVGLEPPVIVAAMCDTASRPGPAGSCRWAPPRLDPFPAAPAGFGGVGADRGNGGPILRRCYVRQPGPGAGAVHRYDQSFEPATRDRRFDGSIDDPAIGLSLSRLR